MQMADCDSFRISTAQACRLSMGHMLSSAPQKHEICSEQGLVRGQTCSSVLLLTAAQHISHAEPKCLSCACPDAVMVRHLHAFGVSATLELRGVQLTFHQS